MMVPQLEMLTGRGATKSLTSAGKEAEERLFRKALPNASQVPGGKTSAAVRLTDASPKVSPGRLTPAIGSVIVAVLTAPSANPAAVRLTRFPQQGIELAEKHWLVEPLVTHFSRPSTGLPPPLVKSKVISRSPAVRLSVLGPVVVRFGWVFWLISKSMLAEPSTFDRSHARYRKLLLLANSLAT